MRTIHGAIPSWLSPDLIRGLSRPSTSSNPAAVSDKVAPDRLSIWAARKPNHVIDIREFHRGREAPPPGLYPGTVVIHHDVDDRDKPGHDGPPFVSRSARSAARPCTICCG